VALQRSDMVGFSRGLHTDSLGVDGALLEAQDVVITREGELRKRGPKNYLVTTTGGHASGLSNAGNAISAHGIGTLAVYIDSGGTTRRVSARPIEAVAFTHLGSTREAYSGAIGTGYFDFSDHYAAFVHGGEIIMGGGTTAPVCWSGSVKADYTGGTASTTSGSTTITGTGTAWMANAEAGMYLWFDSTAGGGLSNRMFRIVSVNTDTSITVDRAPDATVASKNYIIQSVGAMMTDLTSVWSGYTPEGSAMCSHQGRVFIGNTRESAIYKPERIRWSALPQEGSGKYIGRDYWQANAYTDIGTGLGGDIVALASVGSDLVILKEGAVYALRGAVASDGSDLGARVDLVSANHGLQYARGHAMTKIGLVFADPRGVFVYANGEIRSLTQGRIQSTWTSDMSVETIVSAVGDRIIFCDQGSGRIFVYDISMDVWSTQSSQYYNRVVQTYYDDGAPEYELGFRAFTDAVDDWSSDWTAYPGGPSQDPGLSSAPDMQVVTHPIPLTSPVGNARPVRVDVNGFATDDAELAVSLIPGRQGGTEHAVGTLPAGTSDKSHRLRVPPGASLNPYYQVKIAASGTMSDARVYGVSILSAPSGRVDV
jgi:hypothetical protein